MIFEIIGYTDSGITFKSIPGQYKSNGSINYLRDTNQIELTLFLEFGTTITNNVEKLNRIPLVQITDPLFDTKILKFNGKWQSSDASKLTYDIKIINNKVATINNVLLLIDTKDNILDITNYNKSHTVLTYNNNNTLSTNYSGNNIILNKI